MRTNSICTLFSSSVQIMWMTQKRSEQEKSHRGGKGLFQSSHRSVSLNVSKRSLTAEAKKGNVPPSVSIYARTLLRFGQFKLLV